MDAVAFAAEETLVGVVGSFILDKYNGNRDYFSFKHRYMMEALEQQIIVDILLCKKRNESIELTMKSSKIRVFPLKIYISTQNGRQYLMGYYYRERRPAMYRIDNIEKIRTCLLYTSNMKMVFYHLVFQKRKINQLRKRTNTLQLKDNPFHKIKGSVKGLKAFGTSFFTS